MRIICVGDSWTMGHGVEEDVKYKEIAFPGEGEDFIPKLRMCNGWPRWLANKFDCEFIPVGQCGGNNERMANSIEDLIRHDFIKKTDIVIVMFSYPYRDDKGPITNYNRIQNLLTDYTHFYFNSFYPTFKNEEQFNINELTEYFIEPDKCVSDMLREYEIANDVSVWEYNSRSVYDDTTNFYIGDYHPNLLGYKLIAEHIYEKIKSYING